MGEARVALPAKPFVALLSAHPPLLVECRRRLEEHLGPLDYASDTLPFTYTGFYDKELGTPILRQFLSVEALMAQDALAALKVLTNQLEGSLALNGARRVNLDPGYVTAAKVVLATTKDHAHRLYIGDGIYAEVTLHYHAGDFQPWPWTYPDYRSPEYRSILKHIRGLYMVQLAAGRQSSTEP